MIRKYGSGTHPSAKHGAAIDESVWIVYRETRRRVADDIERSGPMVPRARGHRGRAELPLEACLSMGISRVMDRVAPRGNCGDSRILVPLS
jgi:hypothetical protein